MIYRLVLRLPPPTLLKHTLPRLPPHLNRALAPVSLARWPVPLREFSPADSGFLRRSHPDRANPADNSTDTSSNYQAPRACETDVTNFRRCMDENQGSLTICGWYLDQLKACQSAASQY
jgi:hypothetical protein